MFRPIPRVEQSTTDGDKGIVKVGFEEPVAVPVDQGDRGRGGDGDVIGG